MASGFLDSRHKPFSFTQKFLIFTKVMDRKVKFYDMPSAIEIAPVVERGW